MSKPKAFLFDLNGTMIDDMKYHIRAWHDIVNDLGAGITMEQMKDECYGKNEELLERILPGKLSAEDKRVLSIEKEKAYQQDYRPELALLKGLPEFLAAAKTAGIKMAIGSAAIMFNIDFVLDGLGIRSYFHALVSADDVSFSKPHPETFLRCAELLGEDPEDCIVFEDSPKGVRAAANAGMKVVVLSTMHKEKDFDDFKNIFCFADNYEDSELYTLLE